MIRLADLYERFVPVVDGLMLVRGWERDPVAEGGLGVDGVTLGMFMRPCDDDDFRAHVDFALQASYPGATRNGQVVKPAWLSVAVELGLRHLPADRVQRLLRSDTSSFAGIDLRSIAGAEAAAAELSDLSAVEAAGSRLVDAVDRHALATLDQYTGVDSFVRLCRWAAPSGERFVVPAVLGAAGRVPDAEDWLAHASRRRRLKGEPSGYLEYAQRLRAWLQDGARVPEDSELPPLPSSEPLAPPDPELYEPRELGAVRDTRTEARVQREIIRRLRRDAPERSREDLRAALIAELAGNAIEKDPVWIEQTLDRIDRPDEQNVREARSLLFGVAAHLAGSVIKAVITDADDLPPEVPAWMRAPSNAWHRIIAHPSRQILVDLDSNVSPFLDKVWQTRPVASMPALPDLEVWLAWNPTPRTDTSRLGVHIGPQLVGAIPQPVVTRYEPLIDETQSHAGWPLIDAELTRLDSGAYLLQIPVPQSSNLSQSQEFEG